MLRALVVDDEVVERNGIRFLIDRYQFPLICREAADGEEALEALRQQKADLLITDLKMPFMDGLELAQQAKRLYPDISIVIITGYGEFEHARKAIHIGVNEFLLKPINPEDFRSVMEPLINRLQDAKSQETAGVDGPGQLEMAYLKQVPESRHEIELVLHYIFNHYGEEIGLAEMAAHVYMSSSYLSSVFKREMHIGINGFLKNYRMEKAKELLERTNMKIKDVGCRVGYQNTSYFCKSFRDYFGITPEQYRQRD